MAKQAAQKDRFAAAALLFDCRVFLKLMREVVREELTPISQSRHSTIW